MKRHGLETRLTVVSILVGLSILLNLVILVLLWNVGAHHGLWAKLNEVTPLDPARAEQRAWTQLDDMKKQKLASRDPFTIADSGLSPDKKVWTYRFDSQPGLEPLQRVYIKVDYLGNARSTGMGWPSQDDKTK